MLLCYRRWRLLIYWFETVTFSIFIYKCYLLTQTLTELSAFLTETICDRLVKPPVCHAVLFIFVISSMAHTRWCVNDRMYVCALLNRYYLLMCCMCLTLVILCGHARNSRRARVCVCACVCAHVYQWTILVKGVSHDIG